MTPKEIALQAAATLDLHKAAGIRAVDVRGISGVTDYCVVASGTSAPHLKALFSHVQEKMRELGEKSHRKSGLPESGWVILDFIHVVVHLFAPEARAYYNIEKLWQDGKDFPLTGRRETTKTGLQD